MLITGQIGASVFSAPYAAHILLGGKDYHLSFQTAPLQSWLFVEEVRRGSGGPRDQDALFTPAGRSLTGRAWVSQLDDYRWRPEALGGLSPYLFVMWFVIEKPRRRASGGADSDADGGDGAAADDDSTRLRLNAAHPRSATHIVRLRQHPVVPQLLSDAPARPGDSDDVSDDHEAYAAFVFGTLFADHDWRSRLGATDGSPWAALLAWEASLADDDSDAYAVARKVQVNMTEAAAAKRRIRERAREFDARAAEAGEDSDAEYDTDDDIPGPRRMLMPPPPANDGAVEALLEHPPDDGTAADYVMDMLGPLKGQTDDGLGCHAPCGVEVRSTPAADIASVKAAIQTAAALAGEFDGAAMLADTRRAEAAATDRPEVHARLAAIVQGQAEALPRGDAIPYVKLAVTPSIAQTRRLWTLNDAQAVAFAILADVLQRENIGDVVHPERMIITGEAGTGKSRVLQALQWYALQIGAIEVMTVVAYTWRAALLLGTPDNPACTTTTFFAIDSFTDKDGAHKLRRAGKASRYMHGYRSDLRSVGQQLQHRRRRRRRRQQHQRFRQQQHSWVPSRVATTRRYHRFRHSDSDRLHSGVAGMGDHAVSAWRVVESAPDLHRRVLLPQPVASLGDLEAVSAGVPEQHPAIRRLPRRARR